MNQKHFRKFLRRVYNCLLHKIKYDKEAETIYIEIKGGSSYKTNEVIVKT